MEKTSSKHGAEAFLRTARARFRLAEEAEARIRELALDDLRFRAGEQWPEQVKAQRETDKRPCLTINRLPQFIRQVTNELRQNKPSVQVNPVDDHSDPETAEILQGLIRHIEINSNADVAYDTASEHAATMGFGYIRVVTDYCDEMSVDQQEILIKRVRNPFTVYLDPAAQEADRSDARYAFIVEDMPLDEYKAQYPDSELAGLNDFAGIGDTAPGWLSKDSVRVAEYFHVEKQKRTLALLADGSVHFADELPAGAVALKTRETEIPMVEWAKINAVERLEEADWPGKWIPVVPVLGDELDVDGELQLVGLVRYAKDPQRMYNYWASAETEMIALAPRAPFIGAEGQFENHETAWKQANTRNLAYLEYKPKSLNGALVGAPQRQVYEPPIQAISTARMQSAEDLKATTGIYDASLGARSNETSGKAILARQKEGDVTNFHFSDNLARAIKHVGRILVDLIPKIYDTPRVLRIVGVDEEQRTVRVNQRVVENGVERIYDLGVGKYDVTVSVGPSYMSKRQEAVDSMMQLAQAHPQIVQMAGDLMVKNMDWPGATEIAERLKKMLPPQLQEQEEGQQPVPPEVQEQLQQSGQMIDQLTQQLSAASEEIRTRKFEIDSRERIEMERLQLKREELQAKISIEMAKLGSAEAIVQLREELGALRDQVELQQEAEAAERQQEPEQPDMPVAA